MRFSRCLSNKVIQVFVDGSQNCFKTLLFCPPVIVFHCVIIRKGKNLGWRLTQYHRFVNLSLIVFVRRVVAVC